MLRDCSRRPLRLRDLGVIAAIAAVSVAMGLLAAPRYGLLATVVVCWSGATVMIAYVLLVELAGAISTQGSRRPGTSRYVFLVIGLAATGPALVFLFPPVVELQFRFDDPVRRGVLQLCYGLTALLWLVAFGVYQTRVVRRASEWPRTALALCIIGLAYGLLWLLDGAVLLSR